MVYTVTIVRVYTARAGRVYTSRPAHRVCRQIAYTTLEYGEREAKRAAIALAGAETKNGISGCGGSTPLPKNRAYPPLWGG